MTKRGMPSAAQMRVLEALAAGSVLHWLGGIDPSAFLSPGGHINRQTALSCDRSGWIRLSGDYSTHAKYALTNLGRHALEAARASKGAQQQQQGPRESP